MSWQYGIPDGLGPYTYFDTLNVIGTDALSLAKKKLYNQAIQEMNRGLTQLNDVEKIKAATDFIGQVAVSERNKEIAAIQQYCKDMKTEIPGLTSLLENPEFIYNDPMGYYAKLTTAINTIRVGTDEYKRTLQKIKNNMNDLTDKGKNRRSFFNYLYDDYRYKLVEDITVFMSHLTNNKQWIKEQLRHDFTESSFNTKIEAMVMRILNSMNIGQKIASGEDFAAIAASVLIDLEKSLQEEIDKETNSKGTTINNVSDSLLDKIEQKYITQLYSNEQTPVQKALNNLNGIDFQRITTNAKELLGIKTDTKLSIDQKKLIDGLQKISKQEEKAEGDLKKKLHEKRTKLLNKSLHLINFSIAGSFFTKQGAINELILSMLGSNVTKNVATDVINYKIFWNRDLNTAELDTLVHDIGNQFGTVLTDAYKEQNSNKANLMQSISNMQTQVDDLINKAEKQLTNIEGFDPEKNNVFVFHETLKLYSTAETGRGTHEGFGGRNMNILSYIDYLSSAASIGVANNIDRDTLAFFARNMITGAIAEHAKKPLETYLAIYAGMIMFDDVIAMAREAVITLQNQSTNVVGGKIKQVHLYNLNGIYVPASMFLTYLSDSLNKNNQQAITDMMHVQINTTNITADINKKKSSKNAEIRQKNKQLYNSFNAALADGSEGLTEADWNAVSSMAVNNTKVQILFLASFEAFINSLFKL